MKKILAFIVISIITNSAFCYDDIWSHNKHIVTDELKKKPVTAVTSKDLKKIDLKLDDEMLQYDKFKLKKIKYSATKKEVIYYKSLASLNKGTVLYKNKKYYKLTRSIISWIKYSNKSEIAFVLNQFGEPEYSVLTKNLFSLEQVKNLSVTPTHFIRYRKGKRHDINLQEKNLKLRFKINGHVEYLEDRYLKELQYIHAPSASARNNTQDSYSLSGGVGLHLLTAWKFPLNIGIQTSYRAGRWMGLFQNNQFQSIDLGPELQLNINKWENYFWRAGLEVSQSIYYESHSLQGEFGFSLSNLSMKLSTELEFKARKNIWVIGAYYKLIESSVKAGTLFEESPHFRKNSNALGLYVGRSFNFEAF